MSLSLDALKEENKYVFFFFLPVIQAMNSKLEGSLQNSTTKKNYDLPKLQQFTGINHFSNVSW